MSNKGLKFNSKQILQFVLVLTLLVGTAIGVQLIQNFQRGINQASTPDFATCLQPSVCTTVSGCGLAGGTTGAACGTGGQVCCTAQVPQSALLSDAQDSSETLPNNCCNRNDYGSCVGATDQETSDLFQKGYYACQAGQCGACEYLTALSSDSGLRAQFFADASQEVLFDTQISSVNDSWSDEPVDGMPSDNFSVVYDGLISVDESTNYEFSLNADDAVRLWIDNKLIINRYSQNQTSRVTGFAYLDANTQYPIKVLYRDYTGPSEVSLEYRKAYRNESFVSAASRLSTSLRNLASFPIIEGSFSGIVDDESVFDSRSVEFTADPDTTASVNFYLDSDLVGTSVSDPYVLDNFDFTSLSTSGHTLIASINSRFPGGAYQRNVDFSTVTTLPQQVLLSAIADTYVSGSNATSNRNYGQRQNLLIDASPERVGYFRFDISNVASAVESASFNFHVSDRNGAATGNDVFVQELASTWEENVVTYNTRLPLGDELGSVSRPRRNQWYSVDVTDSVRNNLGGAYSLAIRNSGSNNLIVDSRETGNQPYLEINYTSGGSIPTPTPTIAPTSVPTVTPSPNPTVVPTPVLSDSTVTIYASGKPGDGIYPTMELQINGQTVETYTNVQGNGTVLNQYTYNHDSRLSAGDQIRVTFTNDGGPNGIRDLRVDKVVVDNVTYESESPNTYSVGSWGVNGCAAGYKQNEWLNCNGYFQYNVSNVTVTPTPTTISVTQTSTPIPVFTAVPVETQENQVRTFSTNFEGIRQTDSVWGTIFVSFNADRDTTRRVRFFIDGNQINTDRRYRYYLGSRRNGYDVTQLSEGGHNLSVEVTRTNGSVYTESIEFFVVRPQTGPSTNIFDGFFSLFGF